MMKMNWGKGILVSIILFMTGVAVMVSISISKDVDLVAPNYYEREIKYQDEIDRINNTNELGSNVKFDLGEDSLIIEFPGTQTSLTGEVDFYRPSDSKRDFKVELNVKPDGKQAIDISQIDKGLWRVRIFWESGGKKYLSTNSIIIQQ